MLENIKLALRIEGDLFDNELVGLISACKKDLEISGVEVTDDSDPLIERAVVFYCKAYFGYAEKNYSDFVKSYETLKIHLSICGDYKAVKDEP